LAAKIISDMTYLVLSGTLNLQSISHDIADVWRYRAFCILYFWALALSIEFCLLLKLYCWTLVYFLWHMLILSELNSLMLRFTNVIKCVKNPSLKFLAI